MIDTDDLRWKVFVNYVREKHGHNIKEEHHPRNGDGTGICTNCEITFHIPTRMEKGWMNAKWQQTRVARECPKTPHYGSGY